LSIIALARQGEKILQNKWVDVYGRTNQRMRINGYEVIQELKPRLRRLGDKLVNGVRELLSTDNKSNDLKLFTESPEMIEENATILTAKPLTRGEAGRETV
jgi:hypothetical protein